LQGARNEVRTATATTLLTYLSFEATGDLLRTLSTIELVEVMLLLFDGIVSAVCVEVLLLSFDDIIAAVCV